MNDGKMNPQTELAKIEAQNSRNLTTWSPQQEVLSLPLREQKRVYDIVARYGGKFGEVAANHFPTFKRSSLYPNYFSAITAETPTMPMCDRVWGKDCSTYWIDIQLAEVMIYCGLREKMTDTQRMRLAETLRGMCASNCVTMAEFMMFVTDFEAGVYETFHGYERPNPQIITRSFGSWLEDLQRERERVRDIIKSKRDKQQIEQWNKDAVPMPDAVKQHMEELMQGVKAWDNGKHKQAFEAKNDLAQQMYAIRHADGTLSRVMSARELNGYISTLNGQQYEIIKQ